MIELEKVGTAAIIFGVILMIAFTLVWWWVCFIAAGAILAWIGFSGSGFLAVQIVLWLVIVLTTATIGRLGATAFT